MKTAAGAIENCSLGLEYLHDKGNLQLFIGISSHQTFYWMKASTRSYLTLALLSWVLLVTNLMYQHV
jgi:hypothetical protein